MCADTECRPGQGALAGRQTNMARQGSNVELRDQIRRAEYAVDVDAVAAAIVARISVPSDVVLEARELGARAFETRA
jgi:hypothetical protein